MQVNGEILQRLRVGSGLTQTALAKRFGFHPTVISRLESGHRKGSPSTIKTLAEFFGVTVDELCAEDEVAA